MFGLNEFKYMKDPQGKRKKGILLIVFAVLGVMLIGYSMAGALGLRELELTGKIPFLYFLVSFLVQMMLGAIKAKSQLYRERDMELLAGLPVKGLSIGAARMVRMYAEGILVWAGVFLPAMIVYGVDRQEDKLFFLMLIPVCLIAPILLSIEIFGAGGLNYFAMAAIASYIMSGYTGFYYSQQILFSKLHPERIEIHANEEHEEGL